MTAELVAHLVRHRIAGDVDTDRSNSLRNYQRAADREPGYTFGLTYRERDADAVLDVMVELAGVSADRAYRSGPDHIDPQRTVAALVAVRDRLAAAAARQEPVLLATGHPGGLLPLYLALAAALAAAGCELLTPAAGRSVALAGRTAEVRYVTGVAVVSSGGGLDHTHAAAPMRAMLADLADGARPGLVVADHGFAGAAGEAGLAVVGFGDCNDPALFLGAADGKIEVAVPLDDNRQPALYEPVWRLLRDSDPFRITGSGDELAHHRLR